MRLMIFLLPIILFITSCSVFKSSRKIDMTPFSENASTMFSEATKISRPFQWKYLKQYTSIPEFQALFHRSLPLLEALRGIVYYSNQVVAINNSKLSDREKNNQLAHYLYEAMERALENQKVDSLQLGKIGAIRILENIRNAENYLDGIAAASPIINSVVIAIQNRLDEIQADIPAILRGFDREIEKEYAATRNNYLRLHHLREQMMLSVTRLYRARLSDRAELDTLLQEDAAMHNFITASDDATPAQLAAAETYLTDKLNQIDILLQQLDDAKAEYLAKQDELITWGTQIDEKIMIGRTVMTVWAQSHRNLGAGIPVPPLIDVAGFTSGLVGTATRKVVP